MDMGGQIIIDALSVFRSASSESFKEKVQLLKLIGVWGSVLYS